MEQANVRVRSDFLTS